MAKSDDKPRASWQRIVSLLSEHREAQGHEFGTLDDLVLGRYLTGELADDDHRAVHAYVKTHPVLQRILDSVSASTTVRATATAVAGFGHSGTPAHDRTGAEEPALHRLAATELELAYGLSASLMSTSSPRVAGFSFFDFYSPASPVGGDFLDYVETADGQLVITVGDVAGHGVAASLMAVRIVGQLRALFCAGTRPERALQIVNDDLARLSTEQFATAAVASLNPKTAVVELTNAGHLPPLLSHVNGTVERPGESEIGLPLGVIRDGFSVTTLEFDLERGDCLILYTDGVSEACGEAGELYGIERMIRRIEMLANNPARIGAGIVGDLERFIERGMQTDDACVVCVVRDP